VKKGAHRQKILVILGPTAAGKTAVAIHAAKELGGEIISADARQIYRYMDIGTAKPNRKELERVCHHFIDLLTPDQNFNAGEFQKLGRRVIEQIFQRGNVPVVAGGSGLYLRALIDGFFEGPPADSAVREFLSRRLEQESPAALLKELRAVDPEAAAKMLPGNTRRIIRALEVYALTGARISELQREKMPERLAAFMVGLNWERKSLYKRIESRVDGMIREGLIDEVRGLLKRGYSRNLNSLQTVGYAEVIAHLNGEITREKMVELIKQNSRRYAKRQLTWFRKEERIEWYSVHHEEELQEIAGRICRRYKETCPG